MTTEIRPTPETDEATRTTDWFSGEPMVSQDFARKLERERDEARERAESKHGLWMSELSRVTALEKQLEAMREVIGVAAEAFKFISSNWTSRDLEPGETIRQVFQAERVEEAEIALAKLKPSIKP